MKVCEIASASPRNDIKRIAFSPFLSALLFLFLLAFSLQPSEVYAQASSPGPAAPSGESAVSETMAPSTEPAQPSPDSPVPPPESSLPNPEPAAPSDETPIPGTEPTVSSGEPSVPGGETGASSTESVGPGAEPGAPAPEPDTPPAEAIAPNAEVAPPSLEPATPSPGLGVPGDGSTVPSVEPPISGAVPSVAGSEPAVPGSKPVAGGVVPVVASPQPPVPSLSTSTPVEPKLRIGPLSFGFVSGFYQPQLTNLKGILANRQLAIVADPNYLLPGNPSFRAEARNIPTEIGNNPWLGMEAQWELSQSFAVRFTGGVWRGEAEGNDSITTFLRSNLSPILVPRSARYNLVLDQFFLDCRYYFLNNPRRGRISVDLGLLGVAVGYFTMDSLVKVVHPAAPRGGFAAVSSTEAVGNSFITRYGLTGEYFLGKKLALGFSGHYLVGHMGKLEISRHFPAGFPDLPIPEPLSIRAGVALPTSPPTPKKGETLRYATTITNSQGVENVGPRQNVILELDGPELSGYIRFYF